MKKTNFFYFFKCQSSSANFSSLCPILPLILGVAVYNELFIFNVIYIFRVESTVLFWYKDLEDFPLANGILTVNVYPLL